MNCSWFILILTFYPALRRGPSLVTFARPSDYFWCSTILSISQNLPLSSTTKIYQNNTLSVHYWGSTKLLIIEVNWKIKLFCVFRVLCIKYTLSGTIGIIAQIQSSTYLYRYLEPKLKRRPPMFL